MDKQNFKYIIENINRVLIDKFLELEKEANRLSEIIPNTDNDFIESSLK